MDAKEGVERLRAAFLDRLKRRGSLNQVSKGMGEDDGFLAGQKDNERGMRTLDLLRSQQVAGNPLPEEVYHEALFSEEKDPAAILAYSREYQDLRPDPFITGLLPRLRLLAAAGATPSGDWESLQPAIRDLDRLRRRNRQAALKKLQRLISEALHLLEQGERPRQGIGDLCTALGVLAAIYRLAGRRDDAVDVLVESRSLVVLVQDFRSDAEWYQKAAYLLVDLKRWARAEEFIKNAHLNYDLAGNSYERLHTTVDLAYILAERGKHRDSLQVLRASVHLLPEADIDFRLAVHQLMATDLFALGSKDLALEEIEKSWFLVGDNLMAKAYVLSVYADFSFRCGDFKAGVDAFRESLPLFARISDTGQLADLIKFALEFSSQLFKAGHLSELQLLAESLKDWIMNLRTGPKLVAAIEDFQAFISLKRTDAAEFSSFSEQVLAAIPRAFRYYR